MSYLNHSTTEPLGTHLDLTVGKSSVIKFESIPASCLATARPIYSEISTPGAGRYKLSVEPYQPRGRPSSSGCGNCSIQMYEDSATAASPPDTMPRKPRSISSPSVPNSLTRRLGSTKSDHIPSPQASPPPAVMALSGSPAPSTIADSVRGCSSPKGTVADSGPFSPARKRRHRQVKDESDEDEPDQCKKRKRDDGC